MNAIVYEKYGSADVLQLKDVEKPSPEDNEVLIKIYAAAVNATDPIDRKGEPFVVRFFTGLRAPKNPILGDALSGEIVAVGKDVRRYQVGDQVYGSTGTSLGAHAEYIALPEESALAMKPAAITHVEAAGLVDGVLTAMPFLRDEANLQPGQRILIIGASGSVGTAAVQLAKYFGAEVTGVCSAANVEMVKSLGADVAIDYTQDDFTENGKTYDVIFDAVGKSTFSRCKGSLNQGGVYLSTGPTVGNFAVKTLALSLEMLWTSKIGSKRAIFATTGLRPPSDKARDLDFLNSLLAQGALEPVIDRRYSMGQIADAHRYVERGHKKGNVVLTLA